MSKCNRHAANLPLSELAVSVDPDGTDEVVARLEVTILLSPHSQRMTKQTPAPIFRFIDEQRREPFNTKLGAPHVKRSNSLQAHLLQW